MRDKIRELFGGDFFRRIVPCHCYEHMVSVEARNDEPVVRLRWWAAPNMEDTRLITKIRAAWAMLRGKSIPIDDVMLTDETLDQLVDALFEARNFLATSKPQS